MLDPQQEAFNLLHKTIEGLGYSVYDTKLPPEGTKCPFVYLGYTQQVDQRTKSQIIGAIYQRLDVWHNDINKRGDVSAIMLNIKQACIPLKRTSSFYIDVSLNNQDIQSDNSTGITHIRGMLEFKIDFT